MAQESEWLIYNEYAIPFQSLLKTLTNARFVLTSKNYIRTVTQIKPEWLLEIAPIYYDLHTLEKGEVRSALERVSEKVKQQEAINRRSKGKNTKDK